MHTRSLGSKLDQVYGHRGLLKRFSALYGELDIDDILLESQAGIVKRFLLDEEKKPENFLDIVDHLQALPVAYSEVIKVLSIAATRFL